MGRQANSEDGIRTYLSFTPGRPHPQTSREPPPAWLAGAVADVLGDLQAPDVAPLLVGYRADPELPHWGTLAFEMQDGTRFGFGIGDDDAYADLLVAIADGVQEHLPETEDYWAQALPVCPGHAHPARAGVTDTIAWWTCPRNGHRISRIGKAANDDE